MSCRPGSLWPPNAARTCLPSHRRAGTAGPCVAQSRRTAIQFLTREQLRAKAYERLDPETCDYIADASGYRFCVNETAWSLFRDELRIGPDVLPVDDTLFDLATVRMPEQAPSADELLARYPNRFPPRDDGTPFRLVTPADVANGWRDLFRELSGQWA